jgi:hypothetical protein
VGIYSQHVTCVNIFQAKVLITVCTEKIMQVFAFVLTLMSDVDDIYQV